MTSESITPIPREVIRLLIQKEEIDKKIEKIDTRLYDTELFFKQFGNYFELNIITQMANKYFHRKSDQRQNLRNELTKIEEQLADFDEVQNTTSLKQQSTEEVN